MKERALVVGSLVMFVGCSKPEAGAAVDSGAPPVSTASAVAVASAAASAPSAAHAAASSAPSAAPAVSHLEVTGKLRNKPSWSWEPTGKVPGKKANGGISIVIDDLKLDPPIATSLKQAVTFENAPTKATSPNVGTCKATITSNKVSDMVGFGIEEPGCDVQSIAKAPMAGPFVATAKGTLVSTGAPVEVHFVLSPGEQTLDELVKAKKANTAH